MPTPDGGSGVDCGSNPTLHAGDGTELYCPFGPDAGAAIQCAAKSQCCCISGKVGGSYPPSTCEAYGDAGGCACANGAVAGTTQIQCEDPGTDCPVAGSACCASPAPGPVAGCSYEKITGWTYARCVAPTDGGAAGACSAGEVTVCSSTPQCPTGKTCTAVKAKGIQLGVCM